MRESVCVLMSTYNGEKYVREQIDSILNQKNVEVFICIRDDGSSDSTFEILKSYEEKCSNVLVLQGNNIGAEKSFYELIHYVCEKNFDYLYYAFSDQDDIWENVKLLKAVDCLKQYEPSLPNLYYSNLHVIDENGKFLYDKFSNGYVRNSKKQIMAEICAWGCTCVFNSAALEYMNDMYQKNNDYHDNWITWICAFLGNVYYDNNAYIKYRQHGNNASGQVKKGISFFATQIKKLFFINDMKPVYELRARLFLELYADKMEEADVKKMKLISDYRYNINYKFILLFSNAISSGHFVKELGRRIRIIKNVL